MKIIFTNNYTKQYHQLIRDWLKESKTSGRKLIVLLHIGRRYSHGYFHSSSTSLPTRKYYSGKQAIELWINPADLSQTKFVFFHELYHLRQYHNGYRLRQKNADRWATQKTGYTPQRYTKES